MFDRLEAFRRNGGPDVVGGIINVYLRDAPEKLAAIEEALVRGDTQQLGELAHSLKSSSANVGAVRLASACAELEGNAANLSTTDLEVAVAELAGEYGNVEGALQQKLSGRSGS